MTLAFGIDIGGSGIKGAPVDLDKGALAAERVRIPTPEKSTPKAVAEVCRTLLAKADVADDSPVGISFPAPIVHGVVPFIANLHRSWKGVNIEEFLAAELDRPVVAVNDADAAGYAEVIYGAAREELGITIVTTLGTGIGSALIVNDMLVPNTELGHLEIDGHDAETRASDAARDREGLSWKQWGKRLTKFYSTVEMLFSPDLFVVGGGVSKQSDQFLPHVKIRTPIVPAELLNSAGIVGAARYAHDAHHAQHTQI